MIALKQTDNFRSEPNQGPPSGFAFFNNGNRVISDDFNHRLQIFSVDGKLIKNIGCQGSGNGEFSYPKGLCVDSEGFIYVTDCWNHRVQKFSTDFEFVLSFGRYGPGINEFNEPFAILPVSRNRLLVVDRCNHRLKLVDTNGAPLGIIGQRGTSLEEDLAELYNSPPNLLTRPAFEFPNDIASDSKANVYVADSNNHRVVKLDSKGRFILAFGCRGNREGEFNFPYGITSDEKDLLFVTDMNNERIQVFTPQGNFVCSFKGDNSKALSCPTAIQAFGHGKIFVGSGLDTTVRILEYSPQDVISIHTHSKTPVTLANISLLLSEDAEESSHLFSKYLSLLNRDSLNELIKNRYDFTKSSFENFVKNRHVKQDVRKKLIDLFDEGITLQKESLSSLLEERIAASEELVKKKLEQEGAFLRNDDNFDTKLFRLEREDREIFRKIRAELLVYTRLIRLKGDMITGLLTGIDTLGDTEISFFVERCGDHIHGALEYQLSLLEEREKNDSEREKFFRDTSRSQDENRVDFRYYSRLFELVDMFIPILLETVNFQFLQTVKIIRRLSENQQQLLINQLKEKNDVPFWLIIAKTVILTADMPYPSYPCMERRIKEFISSLAPKLLSEIKPDNVPKDDEEANILFNLFNLMVAEGLSISKSEANIEPDFLIQPDNGATIERLKEAIQETLKEGVKISEESSSIEIQASDMQVREESVRISIENRNRNLLFAGRINLRALIGLFFMMRIHICLELKKKKKLTNMDYLNCFHNMHTEHIKKIMELSSYSTRPASSDPKEKYANRKNHIFVAKQANTGKLVVQNLTDSLSLLRANLSAQNESAGKGNGFKIKYVGDIGKDSKQKLKIDNPAAVSSDLNGNILIVDSKNNRILKASPTGEIMGCWGEYGHLEGQMSYPVAIAVDTKGDIYVSDSLNHRVQKFDENGKFILCFGNNGVGKGEFNKPGRIAIDKENNILVVDQFNHRVQKFTPDGKFMFLFGCYGTKGEGQFNRPGGITINSSGDIIVGDYFNSNIQRFDAKGNFISSFSSPESVDFTWISDISEGPEGRLLVSDFWNGKIRFYSSDLEYITSFGSYGRSDSEFMGLVSACWMNNRLYACDYFNDRIQIFEIEVN